MRIAPDRLEALVAWLLVQAGAAADIAEEVAANLVEADLSGHGSHGSRLVDAYVGRLASGELSGTARPVVAHDGGALVRIDGQRAFGQVAGAFAARLGVERARHHGVAVVALTGSGHLGRNGKWPEIAAAEGVASLHFANGVAAPSSIVPFGARDPRLSSNPIALGAPRPGRDPLILDFAVGEMAVNAIRRAAENGERLPGAFVIAPDGSPTDDPAVFLAARAMKAFGGYKGYGLALFGELFAGALTGGGCHTSDAPGAAGNNLLSIYLDAGAFVAPEHYGAEIESLCAWILSARPAAGEAGPSLPGDRARHARDAASAGIALGPGLVAMLRAAARKAGALAEAERRWPEIAPEISQTGHET
jgi:uncharacterized oxidoreductase